MASDTSGKLEQRETEVQGPFSRLCIQSADEENAGWVYLAIHLKPEGPDQHVCSHPALRRPSLWGTWRTEGVWGAVQGPWHREAQLLQGAETKLGLPAARWLPITLSCGLYNSSITDELKIRIKTLGARLHSCGLLCFDSLAVVQGFIKPRPPRTNTRTSLKMIPLSIKTG